MKRLACVLAIMACGKGGDGDSKGSGEPTRDGDDDGYAFAPKAHVDGTMVIVDVTCPHEFADWHIGDQHGMCERDKSSTIAIPAATLGAGHKELEATIRYKRKNHSATVAVDIPDAATGPYVAFQRCMDDGDYKGNASIDLFVDGKQKVFCRTHGGARVKLEVKATPGGKLAIGDNPPVDVAANGEAAPMVDLAAAVLALKVDDVVGRDAKPTFELPYKLDAAGKTVAGKLSFTFNSFEWGHVFGRFVRDIADGKIDRPAFAPPAPGARKNIIYVPTERELQVTDHRGTVKDLALAAIAVEGDPVEHGTCAFESKGQKVTAKRLDIALTVTVTSLADGKTVATKAFPAKAECPMIAMFDPAKPEAKVKPDAAEVMKWLETLAK